MNPTYEDNFPIVNREALACGTPDVTHRTGGSPESLDKSCGRVIPTGDLDGFTDVILSSRKAVSLSKRCWIGLPYMKINGVINTISTFIQNAWL